MNAGSVKHRASIALLLLAAGASWIAFAQAERDAADILREAREKAASLSLKVQRLEDEKAIEKLQRSYGFFIDKGLWKEAADLFAEDGTIEVGGEGVYVGKQRIFEYLKRRDPDGLSHGDLYNYLQLQPVVTVAPDGTSAKGRWHFLAEIGTHQKSAHWGVGTYENEYVKEDGVWKIKSLHAFLRMHAPYEAGWAKHPLPNTQPSKDFPPDRPPTVKYETFPATFSPPYHFKNPATGK